MEAWPQMTFDSAGWGCLTTWYQALLMRFSSVGKEMCEFVVCCPDRQEGRQETCHSSWSRTSLSTSCLFFRFCSLLFLFLVFYMGEKRATLSGVQTKYCKILLQPVIIQSSQHFKCFKLLIPTYFLT